MGLTCTYILCILYAKLSVNHIDHPAAFLGSLVCGMLLHYKKIVKNEHYGYPDEWFPSVSATIGDWYPERNLFQIFIAITSGET